MIKDGKLVPQALRKVRMRPDEIKGMLREQGIEDTGVIRFAFLERTGTLGVFRFSESDQRSGESTYPVEVQHD